MARTLYRLNDRIVRNLDQPGYHADGGGLYLQVTKAGTKSFVYRFRLKGRTRDMGLGPERSVTLAEARAKAAECRSLAAKGIDPIEHARAERASAAAPSKPAEPDGPTFRQFAEQYIAARLDTWRSTKHAAQWGATLAKYAYPVIGDMPAGGDRHSRRSADSRTHVGGKVGDGQPRDGAASSKSLPPRPCGD